MDREVSRISRYRLLDKTRLLAWAGAEKATETSIINKAPKTRHQTPEKLQTANLPAVPPGRGLGA